MNNEDAHPVKNDRDEQMAVWETLFEKARECLRQFGTEDFVGRGDYWVLDDNYGFQSINVAVHRLGFLRPHVVHELQRMLEKYPTWEIKVAIDIPGKEQVWPEMGLIIRAHEVVDQLQRAYLPKEFQNIEFAGLKSGRTK